MNIDLMEMFTRTCFLNQILQADTQNQLKCSTQGTGKWYGNFCSDLKIQFSLPEPKCF